MPVEEYVSIDAVARLSALMYPGTPAPRSGVLDGDRFWLGREPGRIDGRRLVLAIGANAAPAVLAGKLRRAGATGSVPIVRADVDGLGVGHSAHVSRGGYVPAAPYTHPGTTTTWALWLTDEQRAAIDVTEPNYTRVRLSGTDYPIGLQSGEPPATYDVYASRWGVLATDAVPLPLMSQRELHARLSEVVRLAELASWGYAPSVLRALADPDVRTRVQRALVGAGWVVEAGLVTAGRGGPG